MTTDLTTKNLQDIAAREFAHLKSLYFNTAYLGPSPYRAKKSLEKALAREMDPSFYAYDEWRIIADRMREKIARLLKCSPEDISHGTSVSDFNNTVALGYPFQKGDVICTLDREFPSNVLPWMLAERRTMATVTLLNSEEVPLPKNTKIFNISQVSFETGRRVDLLGLGKILRERKILFVVDATQGLGGLEITPKELEYIDILTCASYKWMLGPYGHAFAYFSPRAQELIAHSNATWTKGRYSQRTDALLNYTTETLPGARKYDRGQVSNMLTLACLEAALDLFDELGMEAIEKHNRSLRDHFIAHFPQAKFSLITPTARHSMANILCFRARGPRDGDGDKTLQLQKQLEEKSIDLSVREGNLRLSFHLFNTKQQIETLLDALHSTHLGHP